MIIIKAKETAKIIAKESEGLYDEKEITGDDYYKILVAIANLFEYLNNRYGDDER